MKPRQLFPVVMQVNSQCTRRGRPIQNSKFQHTDCVPALYQMRCSPVCPSTCAVTVHVTVIHQLLIRLQRSTSDEIHMELFHREVCLLGAFQRSCVYFQGFCHTSLPTTGGIDVDPRKQSSAATKAAGTGIPLYMSCSALTALFPD